MNETDNIPTIKEFQDSDMREDDPKFREFFSTQNDRPMTRPDKPKKTIEMPVVTEPEVEVMSSNADVIATIKRVSDGQPFVRVSKLIEALS